LAVCFGGEGVDSGLQFDDRCEDAAFEPLPGELGVKAMKVVHPGLAGEAVGCPPLATRAGAPNEHPQECAVDAARSTPVGRAITEAGWSVVQAAQAAGISARQSYRWLARYRSEGAAGLDDRSSAPHRSQHCTPSERVSEIERLRRQRMSGPQI